MRTDDRLNKLMDDRLKKLKYVGQRRGELLMEATRQSHAKGQRHGRKEERERIKAEVRVEYNRLCPHGLPVRDPFDAGQITALSRVLDMLDWEEVDE